MLFGNVLNFLLAQTLCNTLKIITDMLFINFSQSAFYKCLCFFSLQKSYIFKRFSKMSFGKTITLKVLIQMIPNLFNEKSRDN